MQDKIRHIFFYEEVCAHKNLKKICDPRASQMLCISKDKGGKMFLKYPIKDIIFELIEKEKLIKNGRYA